MCCWDVSNPCCLAKPSKARLSLPASVNSVFKVLALIVCEQYKLMAKEIIEKGLKNRLDEIWGVECTLYYPDKYAGTADCVGVYEGKETIIDFKQSNKPKKAEYIDSWLLQTSAYSLAHNIVYNSNITSCVILVCTVDKLFQEFKIQGHDLIVYQNLFLGRLKKFNEISNLT